jgi:hypothetical protein
MARILIVGGGCRGRRFAVEMIGRGHAVRATTRTEAGRAAIEVSGAECWIGTPDRLATLRGALENVTIACWMLAGASGSSQDVHALHSTRLEFFLGQAIDTTARGLIYDAWPVGPTEQAPSGARGHRPERSAGPPNGIARRRPSTAMLAEGERIFGSLTALNAIPAVVLGGEAGARARGVDDAAWLAEAEAAVAALLGADR